MDNTSWSLTKYLAILGFLVNFFSLWFLPFSYFSLFFAVFSNFFTKSAVFEVNCFRCLNSI